MNKLDKVEIKKILASKKKRRVFYQKSDFRQVRNTVRCENTVDEGFLIEKSRRHRSKLNTEEVLGLTKIRSAKLRLELRCDCLNQGERTANE